MLTKDFHYDLPEELIASHPPERRESSRMMVVDRTAGTISHHAFTDFAGFLEEGDLCVLNDTKVVRSRFFSDDGKVEIVRTHAADPLHWKAMVRPGKRMKPGRTVTIGGTTGTVTEVCEDGERLITWDAPIDDATHGQLALPHYMERDPEAADDERYQTVFAREPGAIAAPTAGLHFTPEVLAQIRHTFLTLHVGVGTFRPVKAENVADHEMHSEHYHVSDKTAAAIAEAGRTVAIGTTVARVLEHCARTAPPPDHTISPGSGSTDIFITPGSAILATGALLTNFHLPCSTLLMLVSAFAGRELVLEAYEKAVEQRYRFYSYGDCMLLI